jgi:hypothetical protein
MHFLLFHLNAKLRDDYGIVIMNLRGRFMKLGEIASTKKIIIYINPLLLFSVIAPNNSFS